MSVRKTVVKDVTTITSFEELQEVYTLDEVLSALLWKEKQRVYHKAAYLKRQERDQKVRAFLKEKGIDVNEL